MDLHFMSCTSATSLVSRIHRRNPGVFLAYACAIKFSMGFIYNNDMGRITKWRERICVVKKHREVGWIYVVSTPHLCNIHSISIYLGFKI